MNLLEKIRGSLTGYALSQLPDGLIVTDGTTRVQITLTQLPDAGAPVLSGLPQWEAERMIASGEVIRPVDAAVAAEAAGQAPWQLKQAEEKQKADAAAKAAQAQADTAKALQELAALKRAGTK